MKYKMTFCIDADLRAELDRLARGPDTTKSALVSEALRTLFERRGTTELDEKLKFRLEKLSNQLNRIERIQRVLVESLALYVRFHFSVLPPLPEADQAAGRALANDRFQAFIEQVGRRVAGGKSVVDDVYGRVSDTEQAL